MGTYDRRLVGLFVEREIESRMSWARFSGESKVSRSTLYRVRDADPRITQPIFRKIERALSLPFDTLTAVAVHDWATQSGNRASKGRC